jgi:hypothetical protein
MRTNTFVLSSRTVAVVAQQAEIVLWESVALEPIVNAPTSTPTAVDLLSVVCTIVGNVV